MSEGPSFFCQYLNGRESDSHHALGTFPLTFTDTQVNEQCPQDSVTWVDRFVGAQRTSLFRCSKLIPDVVFICRERLVARIYYKSATHSWLIYNDCILARLETFYIDNEDLDEDIKWNLQPWLDLVDTLILFCI